MAREIFVSTDVEADGPIPGPHSMLSFASVAFDEDGNELASFSRNLALLDGAVGQAAEALKDRIMQGVLSGELDPAHLKPSTAVAFARDLLDITDQTHRRFRAALRAEQQTALDRARGQLRVDLTL